MDKNLFDQKKMGEAGRQEGRGAYDNNDREVERADSQQKRTEKYIKESLLQNGRREEDKQNETSGYNISKRV
ncbi:hypothetical protein BIV60_06605 [Bacillus sp. MUM 116]|uniref:hypothetical protein n=1 Tax=Bacillus sp. MUM 116 TaxID=1678002 RepID=UPI0008F5E7F2|nr:hypothetical protein [Bacillus sp. MUM 116]OIK16130.1 hypothetical protein BIV60_06605 [Bacillus sp. MUM 116]